MLGNLTGYTFLNELGIAKSMKRFNLNGNFINDHLKESVTLHVQEGKKYKKTNTRNNKAMTENILRRIQDRLNELKNDKNTLNENQIQQRMKDINKQFLEIQTQCDLLRHEYTIIQEVEQKKREKLETMLAIEEKKCEEMQNQILQAEKEVQEAAILGNGAFLKVQRKYKQEFVECSNSEKEKVSLLTKIKKAELRGKEDLNEQKTKLENYKKKLYISFKY